MAAESETAEISVNGVRIDLSAAAEAVSVSELRSFIERIERLEEEKKTLNEDIKDVYGELKGHGFDAKAVRAIIRLRKKDENEIAEEEAILQLYRSALGMSGR